MKALSVALILATTSLFAENPLGFERVPDQNNLTIKTPSLTNRKTAKIRLNNGLEAYLISDPRADQSAAALAMHVGSWSDSPQYPGIAHFLEHLLFMGSETYPEENAYDKQIWDNGGTLNAYTAPDRTVYMFSVNNDAFPTTLDMFSHMFIDPLFNPSGIARELHAVDQEHDKNIEVDGNRLWMVLKETGNPAHPNALFNTGNSETLGGIPRSEVMKWYKSHYSADKAHLILYSTLPIEELEALAVNHFSAVPLANVPPQEIKEALFSHKQEGHIVAIKPIKDLRNLTLAWELPKSYLQDLENKSHALLSYILGGKQEASLYAELKKEELVEDISAGLTKASSGCGFFTIDFDLTPQGTLQFETVIERCFQALNNLKQTGIPPYIFNEMKTMAQIDYEYQSRIAPFQFVMSSAHDMIDEPLETYPQKTLIPSLYDSKQISSFLNHITPEKATYFLLAPPELTNITPDKTERWSGAQYATRKIAPETLTAWNEIERHPHISLPAQNRFIPTNLELVTQNKEEHILVTPTPILLSNCHQGKAYFWEDSQYLVPEVSWIFNIRSPLIDGTSKSSVFMDLYRFALHEKMADTLSYAEAASLSTRTGVSNLKFILAIQGYSEKAPLLLEALLSEMKSLKISKEEFELYTTSLLSSYSNVGKAMPIVQAQEILLNITTNISPKHNEKIVALKNMSYEDFLAFSDKLFQEAYVEAMLTGNLCEKDANHIWNMVRTKLAYSPYPPQEHEKKQMLILSPFQGPYKVHNLTESLGNAAILVVQEGPFSYPKKAAASVLGTALQEDFFDTLRTKQQTAYIAKVFAMEEEEQLYKLFMVQSSTHQPDELIARFELFLETYVKDFESMITEGRFEVIRDNLITLLSTPPTNLPKMASHLNELAFTHKGDFERYEKAIQALKELTYEDFKRDTITFLSRKNPKRIAIMLEGKQPEGKAFRYEGVTAETLKTEGTYISLP